MLIGKSAAATTDIQHTIDFTEPALMIIRGLKGPKFAMQFRCSNFYYCDLSNKSTHRTLPT